MAASPLAPIGVFDSGIGGLSILRALRGQLPDESFVYVADSGHAPYGERDDAHVIARARILLSWLRAHHGIKAAVIACNTATAAAVHLVRQEHPGLPIVGVEPALKPAAAASRTHRVGVLATRGTLSSAKFRALHASLSDTTRFVLQACDGLAEAIEQECRTGDGTATRALCERYTGALGRFGPDAEAIDHLVLGCTHYPFAETYLRACVGPSVTLVEPGDPVARHTRRLLAGEGLLLGTAQPAGVARVADIRLCATGNPDALAWAARRWLSLEVPIGHVE